MESIEFNDYGQFVELTPSYYANHIQDIDNYRTNSKYSKESLDHESLNSYSNAIHNDIYDTTTKYGDNIKSVTSLWICCSLLTRSEIIENCVIPVCITMGTVYIVFSLFG